MNSPKYSRTFHFPFSPGATNDDKIASSMEGLLYVPIVITEKMDGSNTSLELDGCYARTHAGVPTHKSFDQLKALHASIKYKIPDNIQLFGEWCFAKHSIEYSELPGYFLLFGVTMFHKRDNLCRVWYSWTGPEEYGQLAGVEAWAQEIGVPTVPVLFKGQVSSEKELQDLVEGLMDQPSACGGVREGVVARVAHAFKEGEFSSCVMKCVRANHVQTTEHWKDQEITKNKLKL
jgi:hypothetical protein